MDRSKFENIGRNDLCPCGSGNKYKKCCMGKVKRGFTAKVIKGSTGLGLQSLIGRAVEQIHSDEKSCEKNQREKAQKSTSSAESVDS